MYDIIFGTGVQHNNSQFFKDYTPFMVMKYWIWSLCCTICPHGLYVLYMTACTSLVPHPYAAPPLILSPYW